MSTKTTKKAPRAKKPRRQGMAPASGASVAAAAVQIDLQHVRQLKDERDALLTENEGLHALVARHEADEATAAQTVRGLVDEVQRLRDKNSDEAERLRETLTSALERVEDLRSTADRNSRAHAEVLGEVGRWRGLAAALASIMRSNGEAARGLAAYILAATATP